MANKIAVIDPHHVQDTLCDGPFNVAIHPPLATITFTNQQAAADGLFSDEIKLNNVVTSRITMTLGNIVALRDLVTQVIAEHEKGIGSVTAAGGGSRRPH